MQKIRKQKKSIVLILVFAVMLGVYLARNNTFVRTHFFDSRKNDTLEQTQTVESSSNGTSSQIFLITGTQRQKISAVDDANNTQAFKRGDFIVWLQRPQNSSEAYVVRYHIPTKTTFYVTNKGVADSPKVTTEGKVVWLGWEQDGWVLKYFDGSAIHKITLAYQPYSPDIFGEFIVYSHKDNETGWITEEYSIQTNKSRVVQKGSAYKVPYYQGNEISFN